MISTGPPYESKSEIGNNSNVTRNSRNAEERCKLSSATETLGILEFLTNKRSETFEPFHTLLSFQNRREEVYIIKHLIVENDFMIKLGLKYAFFDITLHKDERNM